MSLALEDGECLVCAAARWTLNAHAHARSRCPGAHLVESSAWLLVVSMISTLDITKAVDERGVEVEPEVVYDNSIFRYVSWSSRGAPVNVDAER